MNGNPEESEYDKFQREEREARWKRENRDFGCTVAMALAVLLLALFSNLIWETVKAAIWGHFFK